MVTFNKDAIIAHRTEALATVALTRRNDTRLLPFSDDQGLDFFLQIVPDENSEWHSVRGFRGIGVFIQGTATPLETQADAVRFAKETLDTLPSMVTFKFPFPVIFVFFSMKNDKGYYCWLMQPYLNEDAPMIRPTTDFECHELDKCALDALVEEANEWFSALESKIYTPA